MTVELATVRRERGLSQEQLAAELGLSSKGYISDIESGNLRPSLKTALQIERWSDGVVGAVDLLEGEDRELLAWILARHVEAHGRPRAKAPA